MRTIARACIQYPLAVFWLVLCITLWPFIRLIHWAFDDPWEDYWGFAKMGFHMHKLP